MVKLSKKDIKEIVDGSGELIGDSGIPEYGGDIETRANGTTDSNALKSTQPYKYDMLGRFGFTLMPFMEGENDVDKSIDKISSYLFSNFSKIMNQYYRNPNKFKVEFRRYYTSDYESLPEEIKHVYKEIARGLIDDTSDEIISEDIVVGRKNDIELSEKNDDLEIRDVKLKKIAGLINKLDKRDVIKIINLLEVR